MEWTTPLYSHCYLLYTIVLYFTNVWNGTQVPTHMLVDEKDARRDISFVCILKKLFFSFFFFLNWWLAWCTAASQEIVSIYLSFYPRSYIYIQKEKKCWCLFGFCLDVCFPSATVNTHFGLCADCVHVLQRHGIQAMQMLIQVSDRYFSIQAYLIWFIFHLFISYNIWFFFCQFLRRLIY